MLKWKKSWLIRNSGLTGCPAFYLATLGMPSTLAVTVTRIRAFKWDSFVLITNVHMRSFAWNSEIRRSYNERQHQWNHQLFHIGSVLIPKNNIYHVSWSRKRKYVMNLKIKIKYNNHIPEHIKIHLILCFILAWSFQFQ